MLSEGKSALDILSTESRLGITTMSAELNNLLNGNGIPLGKITEFCGVPGIGKTQLGSAFVSYFLQTCALECSLLLVFKFLFAWVELKANAFTLAKYCFFPSFLMPQTLRAAFLLKEYLKWLLLLLQTFPQAPTSSQQVKTVFVLSKCVEDPLSVNSILSGVYLYRVHDYLQQLATVHVLSSFLREHPKASSVISKL